MPVGIYRSFSIHHPLLERESVIRIVELTIPKVTTLSTQKRDCEKYLFQWVYGEGLI
jgi:hypothetical protein